MNEISREQQNSPVQQPTPSQPAKGVVEAEAKPELTSEEKVIPPEEEGRSPEERKVMEGVRKRILGPLDDVREKLSEPEIKAVLRYAKLAAEDAREKFRKLRAQSPTQRLLSVLENMQSAFEKDSYQRRSVLEAIKDIESQLKKWKESVEAAQKLAASRGEKITLEQIVEALINPEEQEVREGILDNIQKITPQIRIITDRVPQQRLERGDWTMPITGGILRGLGFVSQDVETTVEGNTLLQLLGAPSVQISRPGDLKEIRKKELTVDGLETPTMPGVVMKIEWWGDLDKHVVVTLSFSPEAVRKCVAAFPSVFESMSKPEMDSVAV